MLPLISQMLIASSAVKALIGTNPVRVYRHGSAPQGVVSPYVTWSAPGGFSNNNLEGPDSDQFRVQIDCWASGDGAGDAQIEAVATAVRAALEPYGNLIAYIADERDAVTGRYRISFAFDFITIR